MIMLRCILLLPLVLARNLDECDPETCIYGNCSDVTGSCVCIGGYTGYYCDIDLDNFADNPCGPNGSCTDGTYYYYECACEDGYGGQNCNEPDYSYEPDTPVDENVNIDVSPCTATFEQKNKQWGSYVAEFAIDGRISQAHPDTGKIIHNYGFAHSKQTRKSEFTVEWTTAYPITKVHVYPRQNAGYQRYVDLSVYWTGGSCTVDDPIMLTKSWVFENTRDGKTIPITFTCSGSATNTISINNVGYQHLQIVEVQMFSNNDVFLDCNPEYTSSIGK